jgi:hypothetical protein
MAEKYTAKLEQLWKQNRKTEFGPAMQELFSFPLAPELKRPKSLRGPDFIKELTRLAVVTKDTRFDDAVFALFEHDIVDDKFNFFPCESPHVAEVQKQFEMLMFTFIYLITSRGASLRRVCAQLAAFVGWPAASFAAAMKDLELIYRRRLAKDYCFDTNESELANDIFKKFAAIEMRRGKLELSRGIRILTSDGD